MGTLGVQAQRACVPGVDQDDQDTTSHPHVVHGMMSEYVCRWYTAKAGGHALACPLCDSCCTTHLLVAALATSTNQSCDSSLSLPWNTYSLPHTCQAATAATYGQECSGATLRLKVAALQNNMPSMAVTRLGKHRTHTQRPGARMIHLHSRPGVLFPLCHQTWVLPPQG